MKNYILDYFNQFPSPTRERRLGFWTIVFPVTIVVVLASMMSSCVSGPAMCHTYDSAVRHDNSKSVKQQIHAQSNYRKHKN